MNRRFVLILSLFFIFSFFILSTLNFQLSTFNFALAQTPTPTPRIDLANALGTGDFNHDGTSNASDDLTVSAAVSANPVKTNLSQSASAGEKAVFIGAASGFVQKDEVAIIQMSGANAGVWETAYVTDTRPKGRLLLNRTLTRNYTVDASSKVQVVKIPHYRNVRVASGGTLTVDPWDGASGGVMFLRVQNRLDVDGKIDVSGKGFRGGGTMSPVECGGGAFYCLPGQGCRLSGETYSCTGTPSSGNGEGAQGTGGLAGGGGRTGWKGGDFQNSWRCGESSCTSGLGDGGAGGSAGGGGGGGSLGSSGARGSNGGGGSPGVRIFSGCTPPSGTTTPFQEPGLEWVLVKEGGSDTCNSSDFTCTAYYNELTNSQIGTGAYDNRTSCKFGEYSDTYTGGYPQISRPGGAGGQAGPVISAFSSQKILLGAGGGSGGYGGKGGNGGSSTAGAGGAPGSGNGGGAGAGAIIIFAKDISFSGSGEVLALGGVGSQGSPGGPGAAGNEGGSTGAYSGGGGGGGSGGGGDGAGSGGIIQFFGETISLGNNKVRSLGAIGGSGAGGASGGSGYRSAGTGGVGGSGALGGNGSVGAIFVGYTNSLSGSTTPPANTLRYTALAMALTTPIPTITPTPTPTPTPTLTPTPTPTPTLMPPKRVFVTSTRYDGNLGGLTEANAKCQTRANAVRLGGTWKAWLSDNTTDARDRITKNTGPYQLLDGTIIANNWGDLVDGTLSHKIDMDENRSTSACLSMDYVWTNTDVYGNKTSRSCANWTSTWGGDTGSYGTCLNSNYRWTNRNFTSCNYTLRLYCFEQ